MIQNIRKSLIPYIQRQITTDYSWGPSVNVILYFPNVYNYIIYVVKQQSVPVITLFIAAITVVPTQDCLEVICLLLA